MLDKIRAYLEAHPNIVAALISLIVVLVADGTGADATAVRDVIDSIFSV